MSLRNISVSQLNENNLKDLIFVNDSALAIIYPEIWYLKGLEDTRLCFIIYLELCPVGAVKASLHSLQNHGSQIYIETLSVLKQHRNMGFGSCLMKELIKVGLNLGATQIYVHVQSDNNEATRFYMANGFHKFKLVRDYYKTLGHAWIMICPLQEISLSNYLPVIGKSGIPR